MIILLLLYMYKTLIFLQGYLFFFCIFLHFLENLFTGWSTPTDGNYEDLNASCNISRVSGCFHGLQTSLTFSLIKHRLFAVALLVKTLLQKTWKAKFAKFLECVLPPPLIFLTIFCDWNELESSAWSEVDCLSKTFTNYGTNYLISQLKKSAVIHLQEETKNFRFTCKLLKCFQKSAQHSLPHVSIWEKSKCQWIPHTMKATRICKILHLASISS